MVVKVDELDRDDELVDELAGPPQARPPANEAQVPPSSLAALKLSETLSAPLPLTMSSFAL